MIKARRNGGSYQRSTGGRPCTSQRPGANGSSRGLWSGIQVRPDSMLSSRGRVPNLARHFGQPTIRASSKAHMSAWGQMPRRSRLASALLAKARPRRTFLGMYVFFWPGTPADFCSLSKVGQQDKRKRYSAQKSVSSPEHSGMTRLFFFKQVAIINSSNS